MQEAQSLNHWTAGGAQLCSFLALLCHHHRPQEGVHRAPWRSMHKATYESHPRVSPPASVCTRTSLEPESDAHVHTAHWRPTVPISYTLALLVCFNAPCVIYLPMASSISLHPCVWCVCPQLCGFCVRLCVWCVPVSRLDRQKGTASKCGLVDLIPATKEDGETGVRSGSLCLPRGGAFHGRVLCGACDWLSRRGLHLSPSLWSGW